MYDVTVTFFGGNSSNETFFNNWLTLQGILAHLLRMVLGCPWYLVNGVITPIEVGWIRPVSRL